MSITPNAVINGDCLEVMKEIDAESIGLILCDLPYGATQNKWDVVIPPAPLWEQYERIIKPNGAIILFGQDKFTATMMLSNPKLHRYNIIWDKVLKSGFLNSKKMPLREHEDIMVFYKSPPPYNPQMVKGEKNHSKGSAVGKQAEDIHSNRSYGNYTCVQSSDSDMKYPASIWHFPKPHPSVALHATEKPIDLLRYIIRTYTLQGGGSSRQLLWYWLYADRCQVGGTTVYRDRQRYLRQEEKPLLRYALGGSRSVQIGGNQ